MIRIRVTDACISGMCFVVSGAVGTSRIVEWEHWVIGAGICAGVGCMLALVLRTARPLLGSIAFVAPILFVSPPRANEYDGEGGAFQTCGENLDAITNALLAYQEEHGHLPPTHIADESGQRMHSWRVLILPYLGYEELYNRYRFDEPWNGPHNRLLWEEEVEVYQCPKDREAKASGFTSYLAVVGDRALWSGTTPHAVLPPRDLRAWRLLVVEIPNSRVRWSEPRDLSANADHRPDVSRYEVLRSGNHVGLNQTIAVPSGVAEITDLWTIEELDAWIDGDDAKQTYYRAKRIGAM